MVAAPLAYPELAGRDACATLEPTHVGLLHFLGGAQERAASHQ